ncbi:SIA8E sialyltransferase, partial [Uria aalge]|nr:SIA8E sialyltransferase [Uria aalge]
MGYTDPSSSRDLLGNRTLFFIFICAFAVVTLLQQILYGRNYLKRGLQFSWQNGEELANWTGTFNFTDDGAVKSGSDTGTRYFEFYEGPLEYNSTKCLELRQDIIEVKVLSISLIFFLSFSFYRSTLSRCCNAPAFLFTTQKNTPLGTKLKYEVDTSGIFHINQEIFKMFPKDMPYHRSQFKKCAVVGNGGILKNSKCGREIDSADFVFRCNLPPISEKYFTDVGVKTDVVTVNPSIITERFHKLEKWRKPFYDVLQVYENASVLLPAFYNTRNTDVSIRVKYVLDDFESQQAVYYFHPQYLINVSRYWLGQGVRAKRISTGLILVTAALELCEEVHLFGFWAFPMNPSGIFITHHYYDNVKPRPGFHAMPSEIFNFLHMHSKGILRVHTGTCGCC